MVKYCIGHKSKKNFLHYAHHFFSPFFCIFVFY